MIILAASLMIFRSFGDVPDMGNATGKLGMAPSSHSTPGPSIGQPASEAPPAQVPVQQTRIDSSPSSWTRLPSILLLVILLTSGMCVMFRKMETER